MPESRTERWLSIADFLAEWLHEARLDADEQAVLERYYESYWACFGWYIKHHYANQTLEATTFVRQGPRRRLEIGAGCGTEAFWFALHGALVTSIDVNEKRLKVTCARQAFVEKQLGQTTESERDLGRQASEDGIQTLFVLQALQPGFPR